MSDTPLGRFCWYELLTTDPDAAPDFYGQIAGRSTAPFEGPGDQAYTMWMNGDTALGGIMQLPEEAIADGAPHPLGGMFNKPAEMPMSAWLFYIRVPDVNAALEKVEELGGTVLNGPMEVPGGDWVAQCAEPQGAAFAVHAAAQA